MFLYFFVSISRGVASDKCDAESECLTFTEHMTVAGEMWERHLNRTIHDDHDHLHPTIVFTTEAINMVTAQKAFVSENRGVARYPDFQFNFITNPHDVTPNSGFIKDSLRTSQRYDFSMYRTFLSHLVVSLSLFFLFSGEATFDADEIMMSVLSTVKAQLFTQVTVANCCSGLHQILNDFLSEGCGAVAENTYQCLQDTDDPLLVPCCGYNDECVKKKKQISLKMEYEKDLEISRNQSLQCNKPINSEKWLFGPRFGNVHHELDGSDHLAKDMILNTADILLRCPFDENEQLSSLLAQTICLPQSQFRNTSVTLGTSGGTATTNQDVLPRDALIRQWAVKLIYLALHYHQHKYAIPEAEQRYDTAPASDGCPQLSQVELTNKYGVGRFDYECPGAKYLIISLRMVGLGANVRSGIVPALMLGLMTDRIVLLTNNIPESVPVPIYKLHESWPLASCPREDFQCFFWPTSPCVLTEEDITNAYALNTSESRDLHDGIIPHYADHQKVWFWDTDLLPIHDYHAPSADKLYAYAQQLLSRQPEWMRSEYKDVLQQAVEYIRNDDGIREGFQFTNSRSKIQHTLTIYALRPLPHLAKMLETQLRDIIPDNFNPNYSIGLPVRGSSRLCDCFVWISNGCVLTFLFCIVTLYSIGQM